MPVELDQSDEVCRSIIYYKMFDDESHLHLDALLFDFKSASDKNGVYHESAILRRLAPEEADVHRVGCAIVAAQNDRPVKPGRPDRRRYYCGYRSAPLRALPVAGDGFAIEIENIPEHGEESHLDVRLTITIEGASKQVKANRRSLAGMELAEAFGPPASHRCECDLHDDQHPFERFGADCLSRGLARLFPDLVVPTVDVTTEPNLPGLAPPANDDPNPAGSAK